MAINKPNIQLFRNDEFSKAMMDVGGELWRQQQVETWRLQDDFARSKFFGAFVWDYNLFDLARFFSREYWSNNFGAILEAMRIAGTHESFLIVLRSALGAVTVTFENPSPSHLIIRANPGEAMQPWEAMTSTGALANVDALHNGASELIEFADSAALLNMNETIKLIEHLNVNGVFIEFVTE